MKPLALLTVLLLLGIGGVGYLIYQGAEGVSVKEIITPVLSVEEPEEQSEKPLPPSNSKFIQDTLSAFSRSDVEPAKKRSIGSLYLAPLYAPFSQKFGFASAVSLYGVTIGVTYADDFYVSAGYTFSF